jgi:hypothetical protein
MLTIARMDNDKYQVLDGQHRFLALKKLYENDKVVFGQYDICLEIFSCKTSSEFDRLLLAVNDRMNFDAKTIDVNRIPLILDGINKVYKYNGRDLIQDGGKAVARPLINATKFGTELMSTKKYTDGTVAGILVNIICRINRFLFALDESRWSLTKVTGTTIMGKARAMGAVLGVDPKLRWMCLIDQPEYKWSEIWSAKTKKCGMTKPPVAPPAPVTFGAPSSTNPVASAENKEETPHRVKGGWPGIFPPSPWGIPRPSPDLHPDAPSPHTPFFFVPPKEDTEIFKFGVDKTQSIQENHEESH